MLTLNLRPPCRLVFVSPVPSCASVFCVRVSIDRLQTIPPAHFISNQRAEGKIQLITESLKKPWTFLIAGSLVKTCRTCSLVPSYYFPLECTSCHVTNSIKALWETALDVPLLQVAAQHSLVGLYTLPMV